MSALGFHGAIAANSMPAPSQRTPRAPRSLGFGVPPAAAREIFNEERVHFKLLVYRSGISNRCGSGCHFCMQINSEHLDAKIADQILVGVDCALDEPQLLFQVAPDTLLGYGAAEKGVKGPGSWQDDRSGQGQLVASHSD